MQVQWLRQVYGNFILAKAIIELDKIEKTVKYNQLGAKNGVWQ